MILRNLEVTPDDPVSRWGFEGVLTAFERGDLPDWHQVFLAYRDDAVGEIRAFVNELEGETVASRLLESICIPELLVGTRVEIALRCYFLMQNPFECGTIHLSFDENVWNSLWWGSFS